MAILSRNSFFHHGSSSRYAKNLQASLTWLTAAAVCTGWAPAVLAQDDDVKACAEAYEQAQVNRNSGKLRESEEQLRVCVRDVCPDFVKVDCGQWLSDVRREMPSVILMVADASGNELTEVKVTLDGAVLTAALDGRAFEVNPGPHEFTFEGANAKRTERVSIRQGEKNRVIKIELSTPVDSDADGLLDQDDRCPSEPGTAAKGGCPEAPPPAVAPSGLSGLEVGAIVASGVAVLGFATFGVAGGLSRANTSEATDTCGKDGLRCSQEQIEDFRDKEKLYNPIANVGAIVGGVGAATAVVLFALSLEDAPDEGVNTAGEVRWSIGPTWGGAWVGAQTQF